MEEDDVFERLKKNINNSPHLWGKATGLLHLRARFDEGNDGERIKRGPCVLEANKKSTVRFAVLVLSLPNRGKRAESRKKWLHINLTNICPCSGIDVACPLHFISTNGNALILCHFNIILTVLYHSSRWRLLLSKKGWKWSCRAKMCLQINMATIPSK